MSDTTTAPVDLILEAMTDGTYWDKVKAVACTRPRCRARVGEHCTTPNGYTTKPHRERETAAGLRPAPPARAPRLTVKMSNWLEIAAHRDGHELYAPDQHASLSGEAAMRQTADAMERAGLIREVDRTAHGERIFNLTDLGWSTYWTHPLCWASASRLGHAKTCPCNSTRPEDVQP